MQNYSIDNFQRKKLQPCKLAKFFGESLFALKNGKSLLKCIDDDDDDGDGDDLPELVVAAAAAAAARQKIEFREKLQFYADFL